MKLCPWGKSNSARINSYKKQRLVKLFVFTWCLCGPVVQSPNSLVEDWGDAFFLVNISPLSIPSRL